jgi:hypothetical protein
MHGRCALKCEDQGDMLANEKPKVLETVRVQVHVTLIAHPVRSFRTVGMGYG